MCLFNLQVDSCFSLCFVAVERGLVELRKLGIEQQLWEASRKEIDQPLSSAVANHKSNADSETSP